ncbi:MAG TPA: dephospho-CoA kinase [Cellvibrio sp.]|nr:dephospho-CoA kinase [Cellvibrio sp.]
MIIGLTGGIGSGKSEVSRRFQALGIEVVDADEASRELVKAGSPALTAIAAHFGDRLIKGDGSLDRAQLRTIIFNDPAAKTWLENLLHPLIRTHIIQQLNASNSPYTILASPLLLETSQYELVDRVLVVDTTEDLQLARASARDSNKREQISAIMKTQLPRSERCARADDIILNDGDLAGLDRQVAQLHTSYLAVAQQHD